MFYINRYSFFKKSHYISQNQNESLDFKIELRKFLLGTKKSYICIYIFRLLDVSQNIELNLEALERQAEMLKAIAHPLRIAIITALNTSEMLAVSEIQKMVGIEQSVTSHHLGILKTKGLLVSQRDGKKIRYGLKYEKLTQIIECINSCKERI